MNVGEHGIKGTGKRITGVLQTYNLNVINWMTRRQTAVTADICQGELYAINSGLRHGQAKRNLLNELDLLEGPEDTVVTVQCDNRAAIVLTDQSLKNESAFYDPSLLYAMDAIKRGELVQWIAGKENPADLLTKFIENAQFRRLFSMLNIRPKTKDDETASEPEDVNGKGDDGESTDQSTDGSLSFGTPPCDP